MKRFTRLLIGLILLISSCSKPIAKMNDEYVEVNRPGYTFGILEIIPLKIDSVSKCPTSERVVASYTFVDRKSNRSIGPNDHAKVCFNKRNRCYRWNITTFTTEHAQRSDADIFYLKPHTWYRVVSQNTTYGQYFIWSGKKGDYFQCATINPGAW